MISNIKVIRQKLLLTQLEFACKLGISKQMVSNYEGGKYNPSMKMIKKIMELCRENGIEVKTDDFFLQTN